MAKRESEGQYPGSDRDAGGQYGGTAGKLDEGRHGDHFNDSLDPAYNTLTNATFYGPGGQVLQNPGRDLSTRQDLNKQHPSWGQENVPDRSFYSEGERIGLQNVNEIAYGDSYNSPQTGPKREVIMIDPHKADRGKES